MQVLQRILTLVAGTGLLLPAAHASGTPSTSTGTWSAAATMTVERSRHTATALQDGRVLVAGALVSWPGPDPARTAEVYDPAAGNWTATSPLNASRMEHAAVRLADGRVLVAGGSYQQSAEVYSPATNSWSPTGSMNDSRSDFTATLLPDGRVLVVGGHGGSLGILATAELYNPPPAPGAAPRACVSLAGGTPQPSSPTAPSWWPAGSAAADSAGRAKPSASTLSGRAGAPRVR